MPVEPSEVLVLLLPLTGDELTSGSWRPAYHVNVRLYPDEQPFFGRFQLHVRRTLAVVRKPAHQRVAVSLRTHIILQSVILPLGNRPLDEPAQGAVPDIHRQDFFQAVGVAVLVPALLLFPGIEANVAFRDAVVRLRLTCLAVCAIDSTSPRLVGTDVHPVGSGLEEKACRSAADMTEAVQAEIPRQHSYQVLAGLQVRCYLHLIVIACIGCRSPFQSSLENNELLIDVKPILGIRCNLCLHRGWHLLDVRLFAPKHPRIGTTLMMLQCQELSLPVFSLPQKRKCHEKC